MSVGTEASSHFLISVVCRKRNTCTQHIRDDHEGMNTSQVSKELMAPAAGKQLGSALVWQGVF